MNSQINQNTTFVILHKTKSNITKQLLRYLSKYYPNENYIFADGDDSDELNSYIELLNFNSLKYFHAQDLTINHFFMKISQALDMVETKYSMFIEFDDFIFPESIQHLEDFLDNNNDYISCGYPIPGIEVSKKNVYYYDQFTPEHSVNAHEDNSLANRIKSFKNFYVSYFDLYRTDVLIEMNNSVKECQLSSIMMYEFILAFSAICLGKQKRLRNGIHYIRQFNTSLETNLVQGQFVREMLEKNFTQDLNLAHTHILNKYIPKNLQEFYSEEFFNFFQDYTEKRIFRNFMRQKLRRIGLGWIHRQKFFKKKKNIISFIRSSDNIASQNKDAIHCLNNFLMEDFNETSK